MPACDVLVLSPFRRPTFRGAISPSYPVEEPWDSPPFLMAGALEASGLSVELLALQNIYPAFDESRDLDELRTLLSGYSCRVALFTSDHFIPSRSTATIYGVSVVAKLLRESGCDLLGIAGRLATTVREGLFDAVSELDMIVLGECEEIIGPAVAAAVSAGPAAARGVTPSVVVRVDERQPAEFASVANVDALPMPAFHLARRSVELFASRRAVEAEMLPFSLRTSLGCVFKCKFCAGVPHWRDYRRKSKQRVGAELDALYGSLPEVARLSFLEDEIATRDEGHVRVLNELLTARSVRLDGLYTHASMLTPRIASLLAPITNLVLLGLDNASDEILRSMGKGQRLDTVLDAVECARGAGLPVHLEWIIGSPEETVDSLITSLGAIFSLLASGIVASLNTYVYCPHPGTEYRVRAADYGLTIHEPFEMQESGGFPACSTAGLTRSQVFTAYLMSQLVIAELRAAGGGGRIRHARPPNRAELRRLFASLDGGDARVEGTA